MYKTPRVHCCPGGPTTLGVTGANVEACVSDVHGRGMKPCPDEHDMAVDTGRSQLLGMWIIHEQIETLHHAINEEELPVGIEHLPDEPDIAPCPNDDHEPLPTPIDDPQDGAATEPSHVAEVSDTELDGCNVTDGVVLSLRYLFPSLYQKHEAELL
ncbi:Histidinol-phosphate aminotransferase, chloroplastic [Olea europaea subsp. europaea]|uniref:Histidinol-phosphate aminotransferase, chloroplastic n=1 Tax=Olea europaea subsp. europaea TaxID=158383 RepID=A0A8S0UX25_OLEEU|nr:Histidinol-phosphate aminotransferase, chloroplastic [Olea europaea subsp. europaea]